MTEKIQLKSHLSMLQTLLKRKQALLTNRIGDDIQLAISDHPADFVSQAALGTIQDTSLGVMRKQQIALRNLDAAIDRLMDGKYGKCIECEEKIPPERLEAFPEAALCIYCQHLEERREKNMRQQSLPLFEPDEDLLLGYEF